jgi:hypothetical protein
MEPYRIFLSSRVSPSIEEFLSQGKPGGTAVDHFTPIAVPKAIEGGHVSSKRLPKLYIDGLNVSDAFVLVIGNRIAKPSQDEYGPVSNHGESVLAFYKTTQFRETGVDTFLRALETKYDFENLLRSLDARFDRGRDGHLAPLQLADNLSGKTICLYRGGGIGDAIHYVRYARALQSRGARVIVVCGAREASLLANADGVDAVFPGAEASVCDPVLPDLPDCDFGISFVAVPFTCSGHVEDICWPGPYLRVDAQRIQEARRGIGSRSTFKVGVCWHSGGGGHRAIPIRELFPIFRAHVDSVQFINLQRGERQADVQVVREEGLRITDLETPESSLMDTAAVISNLDLVISVDTMICHLAGAIGKPVWTILAHTPEWRWSLDKEDTPWYASMRLLRSGPDTLYGPVVERISQELARFKPTSLHSLRSVT